MKSCRTAVCRALVTLAALAVLLQPAHAGERCAKTERVKSGASGVTESTLLSRYHPALAGTPGDTPVYILDSGKPGGAVLIVGGTHGNEPSGYVAALLLAENARPTAGKLFIMPYANRDAVSSPSKRKGAPRQFSIKTPGGPRIFPFGSRLTNPAHQAADPAQYTHPRADKSAPGDTVRNLNRVYPGKPDGLLTEQVAYAVVALIRRERIDMAVDLHEANPTSPIQNVMIAHDRAADLAAEAVIRLQTDGIPMRLDLSPPKMYGLSHREWGDNTETLALLMETVNPAQGPGSENATEATIVTGKNGNPLAERVARHTTALRVLLDVYTEQHPNRAVSVTGIPGFAAVKANLGQYLKP